MAEVVTPYECEHLVASLQPLRVEEAGAEAWVAQAAAVERLSVGAVLQSAGGETEAVARLLADTEDKVSCDWLTQISILSSHWSRWPCSCSSWPRWRPGARACCRGCCAHARPAPPSPPTPSCSTRRAASGSCISTMSTISIISTISTLSILPPQPPGDGSVPRGRGGGAGGRGHGPAGLLRQEHHPPALPHRCRGIYNIYNI